MSTTPIFYNWDKTYSYQTGTQGEFCLVCGGKGIGKTFGARRDAIKRFIKSGYRFAEFARTKDEAKNIASGYFDKLQNEGYYLDYLFKTEAGKGYIAEKPPEGDKPDWKTLCYFVALTNFQQEKKRTFNNVTTVINDEFIIDSRDKHHRYLPNEFSILANLLDSVFRQQPGDKKPYRVYMMSNAVDFTCPYFRDLGINRIPDFGYSWYNNKHVLFHRVPPMQAQERKEQTLVGRMLAGHEESSIIFDNEFAIPNSGDIARKPSNAQFAFGIVFQAQKFGVWSDLKNGWFYITSQIPANSRNVYALTKKDSTLDYMSISSADELLKMIVRIYYLGGLRYESAALREAFFTVLSFVGVK